jgi:hypothetical protein
MSMATTVRQLMRTPVPVASVGLTQDWDVQGLEPDDDEIACLDCLREHHPGKRKPSPYDTGVQHAQRAHKFNREPAECRTFHGITTHPAITVVKITPLLVLVHLGSNLVRSLAPEMVVAEMFLLPVRDTTHTSKEDHCPTSRSFPAVDDGYGSSGTRRRAYLMTRL